MATRTCWRLSIRAVIVAAAYCGCASIAFGADASSEPSTRMSGHLDVAVVGVALADRPIQLNVTLLNTGSEPISYWTNDPENPPGAHFFSVTVAGSDAKARQVQATNIEPSPGSGVIDTIQPGVTTQIPLVLAPLPVGVWTVQVTSKEEWHKFSGSDVKIVDWPEMPASAPVAIAVKNDANATATWDRDLLARVRSKDFLAEHIATHYHIRYVIDAELDDLAGADSKAAWWATFVIGDLRPLPEGADKAIETGISTELGDPQSAERVYALEGLLQLAKRAPTDEMLSLVLAVARTQFEFPFNDQIHVEAVSVLSSFPQAQAADALNGFLNDPSENVRTAAKWAILHPEHSRPTTQ